MDTLPNLDLATRFGRVRCFVNIGEHGKSYPRNFWRVGAEEWGDLVVLLRGKRCGSDVLRSAIGRLYLKSRLAFGLEFTIEEWKLKSWGLVQVWAD